MATVLDWPSPQNCSNGSLTLHEKVNEPFDFLYSSILLRLQSDRAFVLKHIYVGSPCFANCYGHGQCTWKKQQAICKCDQNQTSGQIWNYQFIYRFVDHRSRHSLFADTVSSIEPLRNVRESSERLALVHLIGCSSDASMLQSS